MTTKVPDARSGELTSIINRDIFDEMPGDAPEGQRERWSKFRKAYHEAHNLHEPQVFPVQVDFELNGREMPLGNVADMTLEEAWASERIHGLRELHRAGGWRENPICAHCMGGEL